MAHAHERNCSGIDIDAQVRVGWNGSMPPVTDIRARLGLPETAADWYDTWENVGGHDEPVPLPTAAQLETLLTRRLGCDPIDAAAVAAARPDPHADPELWWVMERCYRQLLSDLGGARMLLWPQLPDSWGATGRFVHLYALLAAIPVTLEHNRSLGIDDDVTWATLSNVAEKLRLNRARFGVAGLEVAHWFTLHFRGSLYRFYRASGLGCERRPFRPDRAGGTGLLWRPGPVEHARPNGLFPLVSR